VNEICGHFSPLDGEHLIKEGDLVKIDLGVHIDGYVGLAAHSVLVGKGEDKKKDVIMAAYKAM
jgi:methionine aminopeptidase